MASLEQFRVFVTVYRAGSVSAAARERHLTQPAVSAQLAALEARTGEALFTRTPRGVTPTERGKLLYAQVADAVDRLERAGNDLKITARNARGPLRVGCSAEFLQGYVLPRLHGEVALLVTLDHARTLLAQVEGGTLDAALVSVAPTGRALTERLLTRVPYVLIVPPAWTPPQQGLGEWLNARPWVSYSLELPTTRRFFTQALGLRFGAQQALVAPDLRAVVRAVEQGLGASLAPYFAAQEALEAGRVQELATARDLIPPEHWRIVYRLPDEDREDLQRLALALAQP
ncbi:LysR family transcriptional regulator [Deinococcus sp.]|uniref:LysR family transcriptional regulator n=1 Tax=Deinococcus sp. TaxID=47478 RepID=UPI0025C08423|nr:LysR family transcriptional regulator [Deinococcus sp.]